MPEGKGNAAVYKQSVSCRPVRAQRCSPGRSSAQLGLRSFARQAAVQPRLACAANKATVARCKLPGSACRQAEDVLHVHFCVSRSQTFAPTLEVVRISVSSWLKAMARMGARCPDRWSDVIDSACFGGGVEESRVSILVRVHLGLESNNRNSRARQTAG